MGKILVLNSKTLEFTEVKFLGETVSYELLSKSVGGYIEHLAGYNDKLDKLHIGMWCNEEHKLCDNWQDDLTIVIARNKGLCVQIIEELAGNIVFTIDGDDGETYGLGEREIETIKNVFDDAAVKIGGKIKPVKVLRYKG